MSQTTRGKYYAKNTAAGTMSDISTMFAGVNVLKIDNMTARGKAVNVYTEQWLDSSTEDFMITSNNGIIVRENVDIKITFIVGRRYIGDGSWVIVDSGTCVCNTEVATGVYMSPAVGYLGAGAKVSTDKTVSFYKYVNGNRTLLGSGTSYTNSTNASITLYIASSTSDDVVRWTFLSNNTSSFDEQTVCDAFVDYMTNTDVWIGSKYVNKQVHCVANNDFSPSTIKLKRGGNSYIIGEITLHTLEKTLFFS